MICAKTEIEFGLNERATRQWLSRSALRALILNALQIASYCKGSLDWLDLSNAGFYCC